MTRHTTRRDTTRHDARHDTTRHHATWHDTTSHDTALLDTARYDLRVLYTSRLGIKLTACASASCFKGAEPRPPLNLVHDIIECRRSLTTTHLRTAAVLMLEVARRPPPTALMLEVVRAPPHTEEPFLPVRTTMTLIAPSWSPSWSLPPPMRAAAPDPRTGDAAPAPSECLSALCGTLPLASPRRRAMRPFLLGHLTSAVFF